MTAKRFRKLFYSEVAKCMKSQTYDAPGLYTKGQLLKAVRNVSKTRNKAYSYAEQWAAIRPCYTYGDNVPPVK